MPSLPAPAEPDGPSASPSRAMPALPSAAVPLCQWAATLNLSCGAMPPPGQRRLRSPRLSPSPWEGGGGQWKPLPLRPRCRRAALESETSKREPLWSSLHLLRLFGSPFSKLLAKSVSASRTVCTKAKALAEPPFSPAHSAASGTIFQVVPKNSFLSSVCLSGESRAALRRGIAGAPGVTGCRPLGEPGRRCACPRWPFRPSLQEGPGHSAPFLPPRMGLMVWDERYLHLGKHPSLSSERSVARTTLTL